MAEINTDSGGSKKGKNKPKTKKMSTRIDFTPMVDLGFLLFLTSVSYAVAVASPSDRRRRGLRSGFSTISQGPM